MCAADLPTLAEQGGTSLDAARIAGLYAELGVPLQRVMQILLHASTVGAAAQGLRTERQASEARDPPLPPGLRSRRSDLALISAG